MALIINSTPESFGEQVEPCIVAVLKTFDCRQSLESQFELTILGKLLCPVRVQILQLKSPVDILVTILVNTALEVHGGKLRNHKVLPQIRQV